MQRIIPGEDSHCQTFSYLDDGVSHTTTVCTILCQEGNLVYIWYTLDLAMNTACTIVAEGNLVHYDIAMNIVCTLEGIWFIYDMPMNIVCTLEGRNLVHIWHANEYCMHTGWKESGLYMLKSNMIYLRSSNEYCMHYCGRKGTWLLLSEGNTLHWL